MDAQVHMHTPAVSAASSASSASAAASSASAASSDSSSSGSAGGSSSGSSGGGIDGLFHDLTNFVSGLAHAGAGAAQHAVGGVLGLSAGALLSAVDSWIAQGAVWLLSQVGLVLSSSTNVDLGSSWFGARLSLMSELAASVMLPMLCCAVIQAVYRQNAAALLRTFLVNLPIALLFTGVAVELVRMGMVITDAMSARFMAASGVDTRHLLAPVGVVLLSASAAAPGFAICLASMLVAGTAMVLWLELVVRAAAITAAALFLPLVLAALVWPAIGHWARRLADTLAALVLSKLVIAAVISLAVGAVEGGFSEQGSAGTKFGDVVVGIALLLLATFSPFVLLRLIPAVEAGAVSHLEGARHRLRQNVDSAGGKVLDSYLKRAGGGDKKQQQQQLPVGEAAKAAVPVSKGDGGWPTGAAVAEDEAKLAPVGKFWKDTHGAEGSAHGAEGSAHGPRGATHDAEGSTHGPRGSTHGPRGAIDASSTDSESAQPPARGRDG